ncbi:hypothetical protein D1872_201160 [compost metagenome]
MPFIMLKPTVLSAMVCRMIQIAYKKLLTPPIVAVVGLFTSPQGHTLCKDWILKAM